MAIIVSEVRECYRSAPSAERMPTSRVRCAMVNDIMRAWRPQACVPKLAVQPAGR